MVTGRKSEIFKLLLVTGGGISFNCQLFGSELVNTRALQEPGSINIAFLVLMLVHVQVCCGYVKN